MQNSYKITKIIIYPLINLLLIMNISQSLAEDGKTDNSPDWFYPLWAAEAKYNKPIIVRDTDSALGRYWVYIITS